MSKCFDAALRLLARRDHGAQELKGKLLQKGYLQEDINKTLTECQRLDLQSDRRFAGSILRWRAQQGYGPQRIRQELQAKGLTACLIQEVMTAESINWLDSALQVWQKKIKDEKELDFNEVQKIKRFLLYRGFTVEIIKQTAENFCLN